MARAAKSLIHTSMLLFLLLIFSSPAICFGGEKTITLTASPGQFKFPFFTAPTPVWQYNSQTPGPILRVEEGTKLRVDLINSLKEPTTIHWHGLRGENTMDGVPGVTQEAVKPGETFSYKLDLHEAGTFWYHPHLNNSEQLERGLKGVLIVEEKNKLPWSREMVWLLDDWLLQKDGTIFPHFNTHHDLMHDGRWGNAVTVNGRHRPEFNANPGDRILLRIINGANARIFRPQFESLGADVIAVDGRPVTEFFSLGNFYLAPGNRLDLDIVIPEDAKGSLYALTDGFPRSSYTVASIKVSGKPAVDTPQFTPPVSADFIPADIFSEIPVSKVWDLNAFRGGKFNIGWGMNQKLWPDADTAEVELGIPQKIVFRNSSSRLHPMHLHGVFFRVLERNGKPAVEQFTRDTVLVGPRETVSIGFIPQHKGIWATHCHILEHAEAGMMTTIKANEAELTMGK